MKGLTMEESLRLELDEIKALTEKTALRLNDLELQIENLQTLLAKGKIRKKAYEGAAEESL